jgi:hypothetical protein
VWHRLQDKNRITYQVNGEHPVFAQFREHLPESLSKDFVRVLALIGATLPMDALYGDMGNEPEKVSGNEVDDDTLGHAVRTAFRALRGMDLVRDDIVDRLQFAEPFRSNWQRTEQVLRTIPDQLES